MKKLGLALIALVLLSFTIGSCALTTGSQNAATAPSASDLKSIQSSYMASYYAERSGSPDGVSSIRALTPFSAPASSSGIAARTTVPVEKLSDLSFASLAPTSFSNFPEPGQMTSFSATSAGTNVYLITVTTSYPSTDTRESYVEKYYVYDGADTVGTWTSADIIVADPASATAAPAARVEMTLSYRDGSSRSEKIYKTSAAGDGKYDPAALSLSGPMLLADVTLPPATSSAGNVMFSSVVVYKYQPARDSSSFWFWKGKKGAGIIGVRYYSEYADSGASAYVGRSAAFEKIVGNFGGYYLDTAAHLDAIVAAVSGSGATGILGSSVVRQEVQFGLAGSSSADWCASGSATSSWTRMYTRISDFLNFWDYILIQDGSDIITLGSPIPW